MSADARTVTVKLLDKEYTISCPDGAEAELLASADYLNQKMQEIRGSGKIIGLERIAVMAALNISYELLNLKTQGAPNKNETAVVERVCERIEETLQRCRQLEISE